MTEPTDPFEARVTRELEALAASAPTPTTDLAARARARADRRHGGRRLLVGAGALAVVALVAVLLTVDGTDDRRGIETAGDPDRAEATTTTRGAAETTTTLGLAPGAGGPEGEPTTTTTMDPPPEPACVDGRPGQVPTYPPPDAPWQEYWQTEPAPNQPLTMRLCVDDVTPQVGQPVTITVVADDPDEPFSSPSLWALIRQEVEPGEPVEAGFYCWGDIGEPYATTEAPHPTPPPTPGHVEIANLSGVPDPPSHRYTSPGVKTVRAFVCSGTISKQSPYRSAGWAELQVTVHEAGPFG